MATSDQFLYVLRPCRIEMITEGATQREEEIVGRHFRHLQRLAAEGVVLMTANLYPYRVAVTGGAFSRAESD